jgi:hypothetical protein
MTLIFEEEVYFDRSPTMPLFGAMTAAHNSA